MLKILAAIGLGLALLLTPVFASAMPMMKHHHHGMMHHHKMMKHHRMMGAPAAKTY